MIACLSIPYFAAAVERRSDASLIDKPLAIGGQHWESKPIYAYSSEAAKMGVGPGMTLRLAHFLSPQTHFMPAGESEYSRTNAEIIDMLLDFPGPVEPQELWHLLADTRQSFTISGRILPARYYLDLDGLPLQESMHFSKEIGQTVRRESHFAPSIGLAADKFTAQVAATITRPNHIHPVLPGDNARFLSSRSVDFLPLEKEIAHRLRLLGIRTLGQLAAIPLRALRVQFGPAIEPLHQMAKGRSKETVQQKPVEQYEEITLKFDFPLVNQVPLSAALEKIAGELSARLQTAALEGHKLFLTLETEDGTSQQGQLALRHATANEETLARAIKELAARVPPSSGITSLTARITDLEPAVARQLSLLNDTAVFRQARQSLKNLAAKYGPDCLYQPALAEPNHPIPEYRFRLEPFAIP